MIQEIIYSNEIDEEKANVKGNKTKRYQFGDITDKKGRIRFQFLILEKNGHFYCVDLESKTSRKITVSSFQPLSTWCVYDGLLAIVFNYVQISIYKFTPEFSFLPVTKGPLLFIPNKKNSVKKTLDKHSDLMRSAIQPCLVMSNSYILLINFPYSSHTFYVYFAFLPDILNYAQDLYGTAIPFPFAQKKWIVANDQACFKDPYFLSPELYKDPVKFEKDKLLIDIGSMKLFFDLQSNLNFVGKVTRDFLYGQNAYISKPFDMNIPTGLFKQSKNIVFAKNPYLKLKKNVNHIARDADMKGNEEQENINLKSKRGALLYGLPWKKQEEANSVESQRKLKRQKIKEVLANLDYFIKIDGFLFSFVEEYKKKEQILKFLNKQKKLKKRSYKRREYGFNLE